MLRDNKLRPLNSGPYLPMLSEGASNWSDLPTMATPASVSPDMPHHGRSDGDYYPTRKIFLHMGALCHILLKKFFHFWTTIQFKHTF